MFQAEVLQHLRPGGRVVRCSTQLPEEFCKLYNDMMSKGYRFEAEILRTGQAHLTISDDHKDLDGEVVSNGPQVQQGLIRLLQREHWNSENETDPDGGVGDSCSQAFMNSMNVLRANEELREQGNPSFVYYEVSGLVHHDVPGGIEEKKGD